MRRVHYAMIFASLVWLGLALRLVLSNAIAREIRLIGVVAEKLDSLPAALRALIFILLWFVFLFGWVVLLVYGTRPLLRRWPNRRP